MYHAGGWKGISQWVEKGVDSGWISCLILQQSQFPCPVDSLDAGLNPQLAVNIVDVCLDCAGSNIQFGGNFLIGETRIHQGQHLQFPAAEWFHQAGLVGWFRAFLPVDGRKLLPPAEGVRED